MSKLLIDNVDVSEKVTISACIHEMHAGSRSDSLIIKVDEIGRASCRERVLSHV